MNLNEVTIGILFLFLPGIIASLAVANLTTHRTLRPADHVLPSFIYGFVVHVLYNFGAQSWNSVLVEIYEFPEYRIVPLSGGGSQSVPTEAILYGVLVSLVFSLCMAAAINRKIWNRIARATGVTRKFGDRDVWSYIMNSNEVGWIAVRDRSAGLYYVGRLDAYSDEESVREIVLKDTVVYDNETGNARYDAGVVYFSFPFEGLVLELYPSRVEHERSANRE